MDSGDDALADRFIMGSSDSGNRPCDRMLATPCTLCVQLRERKPEPVPRGGGTSFSTSRLFLETGTPLEGWGAQTHRPGAGAAAVRPSSPLWTPFPLGCPQGVRLPTPLVLSPDSGPGRLHHMHPLPLKTTAPPTRPTVGSMPSCL